MYLGFVMKIVLLIKWCYIIMNIFFDVFKKRKVKVILGYKV